LQDRPSEILAAAETIFGALEPPARYLNTIELRWQWRWMKAGKRRSGQQDVHKTSTTVCFRDCLPGDEGALTGLHSSLLLGPGPGVQDSGISALESHPVHVTFAIIMLPISHLDRCSGFPAAQDVFPLSQDFVAKKKGALCRGAPRPAHR
jgi:hypothetical protein